MNSLSSLILLILGVDVYGSMFYIKMMSITIIYNKIQLNYDYVKFHIE